MKTKPTNTYTQVENEPTYAEFLNNYKTWIPEDDVSFKELLELITKGEGFINISHHEGNLIAYFKEIFNEIPNGTNRKKALTLFLKELNTYSNQILTHKAQKEGRYLSYTRNHKQQVKSNKSSAQKVLNSLIHEGMSEDTKTHMLASLLQEYITQSEKMLNTETIIIEPYEIKNYRYLTEKVNKKQLQQCLNTILTDFNIHVTKTTIKYAMESI